MGCEDGMENLTRVLKKKHSGLLRICRVAQLMRNIVRGEKIGIVLAGEPLHF